MGTTLRLSSLTALLLLVLGSSAHSLDISCTLRHSAVASLNDNGTIDVHTTDDDSIPVRITGIGEKQATFNGAYELTLVKRDGDGLYYLQPSTDGMVLWVYFPKSHTLTYCKLRASPVVGTPDSYMMIAKCD
jgi:hypothetical protein